MEQLFPSFSLASDTWSGAHPALLGALEAANNGFSPAYGGDEMTARATDCFKQIFGEDIEVFFVLNGTGANVLALAALAGRAAGVICADSAHINVHETAAPERLLGVKLLTRPHKDGKLLPEDITAWAGQQPDNHTACPEVVSISQTTEFGTVYTPDELRVLCDTAHQNGMTLQMDGARFANAVAALGCAPRAISVDAGVDVMCFGGTKNGFVFGEAIVFFNTALAHRFAHLHKQYLQLASKTRFISAQFRAALEGGLWLDTARHANDMAKRLADGIADLPGLELFIPRQSNQLFLKVPGEWKTRLEALTLAPVEGDLTTRWVTSFSTTPEQVDALLEELHQ